MKKVLPFLSICLLPTMGISQTIIGHWNFNGGAANDVSGNGHNGILYGGVTPATGEAGLPNTALKFDGSTGYVRIPGNASLDVSQWTIQAVVKPIGFYDGICQGNAIVWHGVQYSSKHYSLIMFDNAYDNSCYVYTPTKEIFFPMTAGTTNISNWPMNNFIQKNAWYCVTGTYANDTLKCYIDGNLQFSAYVPNQYNYSDAPEDLFLGSTNDNTGLYPYWFNGIIDDLTIWNGVLSQSDMTNYCATVATPTSVSEIKESQKISISPNPANDFVKITLPERWNNATVFIINSVGQTVVKQNANTNETTIDIHALPAGMYIMKVAHDQEVLNEKFIKN